MNWGDRRLPDDFWDRVQPEPNSGCWLWTGTCVTGGYGIGSRRSRTIYRHRESYEALVGPIPGGMQLDHLCRTRCCVNPAHLEPVTPRENMLRGIAPTAKKAAQTSCLRGHPFDEENTIIRHRDGRTYRACRACRRLSNSRRPA